MIVTLLWFYIFVHCLESLGNMDGCGMLLENLTLPVKIQLFPSQQNNIVNWTHV